MKHTLNLIFILLLIAVSSNLPAQKKVLFLLAGQSNAQGIGGTKGTKVHCLDHTCYEYNVLIDSIIPLVDPVGQNWKTLNRSGGSICPSFAKTYNAVSGKKVIMVTAARGGSSCHSKSRLGGYNTWAESGDVFNDCVEKSRKAMKLSGLPVSGIIWMQGERDANAILDGKLTPEEFREGLEDVINRFRKEFGKKLPFYIVLTGYQTDRDLAGTLAVRAMQMEVAKRMKKVYVAYNKTDTFAKQHLLIDNVHYNQDALNDIGLSVAEFAFKHN